MHLLMLLSCIAGLTTAAADMHYRLPTSIKPAKYKLQILTRLDENRFEGEVTITLHALENTKNITLHALELNINEPKIVLKEVGGNNKSICIRSTEVNEPNEYYIIHLCKELQANTLYELTLCFGAAFKKQLAGYYRLTYEDEATKTNRTVTTTQFQPVDARRAFPCFDEPSMKARFTLTLGHEKRYNALSNMPLKGTRNNSALPGYVWSEFHESVPMSSYLVAYSLNEFAHITSANTKQLRVLFKSWARPDVIEQAKYASIFGPAALSHYENLFRLPFPLPKVDQVALPDFEAGAMENWGLVNYRESAMLVDNNSTRLVAKYAVATFLAHELAHQWFGNLVTMKWWTDLWLNEGFATFFSSLTLEILEPDWSSADLEALKQYYIIFAVDSRSATHPVVSEIKTRTDIGESFDDISYKKGSIVVRMIYLILGQETFLNGLNKYLYKYSYQNAEQDDLWAELTKEAHRDHILPQNMTVKSIMDAWTLQKGYPLLKVARDYKTNKLYIKQIPYLKDLVERSEATKQCWSVPLSYTTASELDFKRTTPKAWLTCSRSNKPLDKAIPTNAKTDDWILLNVQMSALYKINYDMRNWRLLIDTLRNGNFEQIHVLNRAQLIDDALSLAWSGDLDYEIALDLLTYLRREREYLPWFVALEHLVPIEVFLSQSSHYDVYKEYMCKLLKPVYEHLNGLNDTFDTLRSNTVIVHKELIASWACRFQVGDCVEKAREYFTKWRQALTSNPKAENVVPINLAHVIYCTGIKHGSAEDWHFAWSSYVKNTNDADKSLLLNALGCTRENSLLQTLLERAFNGERPINAAKAVLSLTNTEQGYKVVSDYVFKKMDTLLNFFHPYVKHEDYFPSLVEMVDSAKELTKYKELFKRHKALQGSAFNNMLKTSELQLQWRDKYFEIFWQTLDKLNKADGAKC